MCEINIKHETLDGIKKHGREYYPDEAIGYLIGNVYLCGRCDLCKLVSENGKQNCGNYYSEFTEIVDYFPAKSRSTHTHVELEFDEDSLEGLIELLSVKYKNNFFLIGWYHSHPGFGCFMSPLDIDTQKRFFHERYNVALVVDSKTNEEKFFKLDSNSGRDRLASYCIW